MKKGIFIVALFLFVLTGFGFSTTASAGCTLGVKDCIGGFWYICERCGSETCMIMSGKRCHRDSTPDTFMGVGLEQPAQARLCDGDRAAIDRALHGAQVRQPVRARTVAVVAATIAEPALK